MEQKVIIFIDGENFYRNIRDNFFNYGVSKSNKNYVKSYEIKANFDLLKFCKYLTKAPHDKLVDIYYYDAKLNSYFPPQAIANQNKFLKNLEKQGIKVKIGMVQGKGINAKQKGTDVYLATGLLTLAWKKEYVLGLLLSSDKDYRPAIDYIQRNMKRMVIEYTHMYHGYCAALANICRRKRMLRNGEIQQFCSKRLIKRWKPRPK